MLKVRVVAIVASLFATIPVGAQSKPQRFKVQCSGHQKSWALWLSSDAIEAVGEVKCGQKVIVT